MQYIFHVHTVRCKHASDECDEDYVTAALELGAGKISFTDHSPFPGNPFKNRMDMEELPGYVESLRRLRDTYAGKITVEIGLEFEYLPSMRTFYEDVKTRWNLTPCIIGQHFYQHADGRYSFDDDKAYNKANEYIGCGNAMIEGMETGLFLVAAHPDRIFKRCNHWTAEMTEMSRRIIEAAVKNDVVLEQNLSSYEKFLAKSGFSYWRKEFWDVVEDYNRTAAHPVKIIRGVDAHSTDEMRRRCGIADSLIDSWAKECAASFAKALNPKRIYLLGSRARGNCNGRSDYDFYIVMDDSRILDGDEAVKAKMALFDIGYMHPVNVIVNAESVFLRDSTNPDFVDFYVKRNGVILYDRQEESKIK